MPSCSLAFSDNAGPWPLIECAWRSHSLLWPQFPHLSRGILVGVGQRLQVGGLHAACLPHKALSSFLLPLKGKLPINERELQTQCLAPRPRSLGELGESECAGRGIGNKCMGCFLWWIHSPLPTLYSYRCPIFGLLRKRFHAWASHELS